MSTNPLLQDWAGPHGLPPFADITPAHFQPAFDIALAEHRAEIDAIAAQAEAPSFANTLAAFDASGRRLTRLEHLFYTLAASAANIIRMVMEHEAIQDEMHRQARTDPLTGLMNRRAFMEEAERHAVPDP